MDDEKQPVRWPVLVVVGILIVFGGIFVYELVQLSESESGVAEEDLTAETYMDVVEPLLAAADPALGADLLDEHGCLACHGGRNAGRLAPGFADLPDVAAERHPPLPAAAYIYEAIIYPGAHTVEDYPNNMPRNYDAQIPDDELGHIIAYLVAVAETVEVRPELEPDTATPVEITADTYMEIVGPLLVDADPSRGEELERTYNCTACHGPPEQTRGLGPPHADVAAVAVERRPPLTAAAYVYESIVDPQAYIVEGYNDIMPRDYAERIPDDDLGDIIAYLLEGGG